MAYGEPTTKKFKHSIISEHIFEPKFQELFCKHWHGKTPVENSDLEIIIEPFRVCKISNFLKSEDFMDELKNELIDVKTRRNSIDLFQFEQSNDLVDADGDNIKTLYHTFQTNLKEWMKQNTKIILNDTISMSSSCYCDTDYLLCHDDNLGDRRIAFILYLSKNWTEEDGGALDLFDSDENGLPRNVVKSIIPEYNSLVLFEVVNNSYHQVAEVTSDEKSRWSINGWFHGPVSKLDKVQRPELVINYIEPENTEVDLSQWICSNFLYKGIMKEIQEDVEHESYAFLSDFLKEDVYARLSKEIQSADIKWKRVGPADVRNYEVADENSLPESLANFYRIFKSISFFRLLKKYTELDLVPETENMKPRVTIELQKWSAGCYLLISDRYNTEDSHDKKTLDSTSRSDYEVVGGESSSPPKIRLSSRAYEKSESIVNREEPSCNTPPSSDDYDEEEMARRRAKDKSPKKKRSVAASPVKCAEPNRRNSDTDDDSDVSDIGDYLSDPLDASFECSDDEEAGLEPDEPEPSEPGSLDVMIQFNTAKLEKESMIYVDTHEEDAGLIHVPPKDNYLCLVYKAEGTCRVQRYLNHYVDGHFFNLVCTYLE